MNDIQYMKLALELAKKGRGWTAPNPMVGAVIVKNGEIIAEGYHERYGQPHAERNALASCKCSPEGATLYVTLEPCSHHGKQPPCVEAVLEAGISRVVVGSIDPNPLVSGRGIRILRENGVEVTEGVLTQECEELNKVFFHYIQTRLPYVVMKYAMTMDGKIATHTGASKWITAEPAREHVQKTRHELSAIMVGIETVLADDPMLNCRIPGGKNPVRIVCDTRLRTPMEARLVKTAGEIPTIIATCCTRTERLKPYQDAGCRIVCVEEKDGHVDLMQLMKRLGEEQIDSILLEGGSTLNWSALRCGIVRKVQTYIAPKLFGGKDAKAPVEGEGVFLPQEAMRLTNTVVSRLGEDILLESEVV